MGAQSTILGITGAVAKAGLAVKGASMAKDMEMSNALKEGEALTKDIENVTNDVSNEIQFMKSNVDIQIIVNKEG